MRTRGALALQSRASLSPRAHGQLRPAATPHRSRCAGGPRPCARFAPLTLIVGRYKPDKSVRPPDRVVLNARSDRATASDAVPP
eukprot:3051143-Pleurochrysis_carterae.AAC.1